MEHSKTNKALSLIFLSLIIFASCAWKTENIFTLIKNDYISYYTLDGQEICLKDYDCGLNQINLFNEDLVISIEKNVDSWWPGPSKTRNKELPTDKRIVGLFNILEFIKPTELFSPKPKEQDGFFLSGKIKRSYQTKFGEINLLLNKKVFPPSEHGSKSFLNNIEIKAGEKIIDIGTGAGILAIAAAKAGARVYATDISLDAIKLAEKNAENNQVKIQTSTGPFFAEFAQHKFDVIIANLPQEILPPIYSLEIGQLEKSISGGHKGNEVIMSFLDLLPEKLDNNTRAYLLVYTVTDYLATLEKISNNFNARLIKTEIVGTKPFVKEYIDFYRSLNDKGTIKIIPDQDEWKAIIYVFEIRKK